MGRSLGEMPAFCSPQLKISKSNVGRNFNQWFCGYFWRKAVNFQRIPGRDEAYWQKSAVVFASFNTFRNSVKAGTGTPSNNRFCRWIAASPKNHFRHGLRRSSFFDLKSFFVIGQVIMGNCGLIKFMCFPVRATYQKLGWSPWIENFETKPNGLISNTTIMKLTTLPAGSLSANLHRQSVDQTGRPHLAAHINTLRSGLLWQFRGTMIACLDHFDLMWWCWSRLRPFPELTYRRRWLDNDSLECRVRWIISLLRKMGDSRCGCQSLRWKSFSEEIYFGHELLDSCKHSGSLHYGQQCG